jgi:hypothetical protein
MDFLQVPISFCDASAHHALPLNEIDNDVFADIMPHHNQPITLPVLEEKMTKNETMMRETMMRLRMQSNHIAGPKDNDSMICSEILLSQPDLVGAILYIDIHQI